RDFFLREITVNHPGRTPQLDGCVMSVGVIHPVSRRTRLSRTGRARPGASYLAVDEGRGHDEEALKDILPLLIETEEHGRIEHLDAEARAHERAEEGATPAQQARPAGDAGGGLGHGGGRGPP